MKMIQPICGRWFQILNCYEEIFTNKREFAHFMGWVRRKAGAKTA